MVEFQWKAVVFQVRLHGGATQYKDKAHLGGPWSSVVDTLKNPSYDGTFRKRLAEAERGLLRSSVKSVCNIETDSLERPGKKVWLKSVELPENHAHGTNSGVNYVWTHEPAMAARFFEKEALDLLASVGESFDIIPAYGDFR